jgi:hypothetical protein
MWKPPFVGLLVALLVQSLCWLRWLPHADGGLGHDWSYFLPRLLAGEYHAAVSSIWDAPWFTPAFGAGLPLAAHPASVWHSFPQWCAWFVGPLAAAQATLLACTLVAYTGMYLYARDVLRVTPWVAAAAALVLALEAFVPARLVVGHLGFHSQALGPLLAWCLLRPGRSLACTLGATLLATYIVLSGNVYGAPAIALWIAGAAAVAVWRGADWRVFVVRAVTALVLSLLLCAEKLYLAFAFVEHAPRDHYGLPLTETLLTNGALLAHVLVIGPAETLAAAWVQGGPKLERHEWEFLVGPVAVGLALFALLRVRRSTASTLPALVAALTLGAVLLLPVLLTTESSLLRSAAWARTASTLFRTWAVYAPLIAVGVALAVQSLSGRTRQVFWTLAVVAAVINAWWASNGPRDGLYNPRHIQAAHIALQSAPPPAIQHVAWMSDAQGRPGLPIGRDDGLAQGVSQLLPYEPLFGYRLERYPLHGLTPGPALEAQGELLRLRDPLSWVEPESSGRAVGGRWTVAERSRAQRFAEYQSISWPRSSAWTQALWCARVGWLLVALLVLWMVWSLRSVRSA